MPWSLGPNNDLGWWVPPTEEEIDNFDAMLDECIGSENGVD